MGSTVIVGLPSALRFNAPFKENGNCDAGLLKVKSNDLLMCVVV
jgi:hypothetical protein